MASLIILLCLCAFMFAAGYQWRATREHKVPTTSHTAEGITREALWQGMLRKI